MSSNALFSDQEIQAAGGPQQQPQAQLAPAQPSGSLFSADEISAAQGNGSQNAPPQSLWGRLVDTVVHPPMSGFTQASQLQGAPDSTPDQASSVVRGAEKAAVQTVAPIAKAAGVQVNPAETDVRGAGETTGSIAENIAEAVGADAALKGLSLGDRLLQIHKVADAYDKAGPVAKAAIQAGLNSVRNAASGAVIGSVHSGKSGAVAGAIGGAAAEPVAGAVNKAAGAVSDTLGDLWNTVTGAAIQQNLKGGIRSVANSAASDAGVKMPTGNIRTAVEQVADGVESKAKSLFQQIDDATGGDFTNVQNKIRNVQFKLREVAGTDDSLEEKLENQLTGLRSKLDDSIEAAKRTGVAPQVADEARAAWRKMSALRDVDAQIKASTFGNAKQAPEVVDPKKLAPRVQKLADTGRLQEALGDDGADKMLQNAYDAVRSATIRARAAAAAKTTAIIGGIGYEGRHLIDHALGGK